MVPRWKALPVSDLIDAALKQPFAVMDFAIKAGDERQFMKSYDKITAGCNACHSTAEQNFVGHQGAGRVPTSRTRNSRPGSGERVQSPTLVLGVFLVEAEISYHAPF